MKNLSRYLHAIKVLDQAAYLLEEFANDHGYCEYCKQTTCDPDTCAIAECIDQCKKLSKEIIGCWMHEHNTGLISKIKNYIDYISLKLS